jgi:adenine-specific DNA-methyltransferase
MDLACRLRIPHVYEDGPSVMSNQQKNQNREKVAAQSPDLRTDLREQLRALVPEAFSEGRLDAEKLKALLGENGDAGPERYSFSWAGKRDAISMLQVPTRATLAPDREHSVNFDEAQHVFIEGENLEVLKVLYRSYFGRVKMIYIDPPYNTGNDFIYPDDFSDPLDNYLRITGQKNGDGDYTTSQVDRNGRIHSAWLSMMYPRLVLARQLLAEKGLIFVSIDEHEMYNLRILMDEIFGEENFISEIVWKKAYGGGSKAKYVVGHHEYILLFAKNKAAIERIDLPPNPETRRYYRFKDSKFEMRGPYRTQPLWTNSMDDRENLRYPIFTTT